MVKPACLENSASIMSHEGSNPSPSATLPITNGTGKPKMKADRELVNKLRALKRRWLVQSTKEARNADSLYHECATSETGGKCRGKQRVHEDCALELKELIESIELDS